jgi:hypothetical protein
MSATGDPSVSVINELRLASRSQYLPPTFRAEMEDLRRIEDDTDNPHR